jgi:hypothetical protein
MPPAEKIPRWQDFFNNTSVFVPYFGVCAYKNKNGEICYDIGFGEERANIMLDNGAVINGKIFKWRKGREMLHNIQMYGKC